LEGNLSNVYSVVNISLSHIISKVIFQHIQG
jgi:hypothetical protein